MKHRLFLAIEVPPVYYPLVESLQSQITKLKVPVEWRKLDKLHLTLNFIGRVDDDDLPAIKGQMKSIVASFSQFTLKPTFLESLYDRHDGSFIYLAPTGDVDILKDLQARLGAKLSEMNLPRQARFLPHITVGYYQKADPVTTKQLMDRVSDLELEDWPSFTVERINLMESLLSKSGSHYQRLASFSLNS